ncbi:MAG: hypothetical protein ACKOC5_18620 [Chloroflexota bacterium]
MEEKKPQNAALNRREALKALVAGSGALAAAAFLPKKWAKPLIESGVVPAHAQSTQDLLTVNVDRAYACKSGEVICSYEDPSGQVTLNSAHIVMYVLPCDAVIYDGGLGGLTHSGGAYSGTFGMNFFTNCSPGSLQSLGVQLFVGGRYADDYGTIEPCDN